MMPTTKKRGLGKGLDALFEIQAPIIENEEVKDVIKTEKKGNQILDNENRVQYIDITNIKPNENQPRKFFDEEKIEELSRSILEHGIIQPLVLRSSGMNTFEIVAGERRWRAARKAGIKKVPSIVRTFSDEENMVIAIIENMQREDLNPIEEAEGLKQMIESYGFTQEQVSKSVSKSRPYITNSLRLLKLPSSIQKEVMEGRITSGHGRALLGVDNPQIQQEICHKIVREGISVRKVEELAAQKSKKKRKPLKRVKNPEIAKVESQLKDIYGTKVNIVGKGNKGAIELEYYSLEELNRLIEMLKVVN